MTGNDENADDDVEFSMATGVRDQRLVLSGWSASHADHGTPGPHVRLFVNTRMDAVLKTSQIPELVAGLTRVASGIDRMWDEDGHEWTQSMEGRPDPNDLAEIAKKRREELEFRELVSANIAEVIGLLAVAHSKDAASESVAALLGVSEIDVLVRLNHYNLFDLIIPATTHRVETLARLREG
jgi:hypothetical protein